MTVITFHPAPTLQNSDTNERTNHSDTTVTHTTCPYCGTGCGITASTDHVDLSLQVTGNSGHPSNHGRLCSKGSSLASTLRPDGRLLHPKIHGIRASWEQAISFVAKQLSDIIATHGPDAVAFYVSGQLLTEDYYVANKLMKGFIGSANIDTNSRLCMSTAVAGHKRAFGEDVVPGCYEDLELADLVVLAGSNTAWCHPVLFQRIKAAKAQKPDMKVVVIDPRATSTTEIADLHLALRPGSDVLLFNGLLGWLADHNVVDTDYISRHTGHFEQALRSAWQDADTLEQVAEGCDLEIDKLTTFYRWFAETPRTTTLFSQGINQSSSGTDKVNAIINCHLATGRIGKPGASPISLTGQPNAMGGREVGGLANQLAAHMELTPDNIARVKRFWNAENMAQHPGLKALDLFKAIGEGKVKAVWIMGTNPVVSLPDADRVKMALENCPLVIASDCIERTDTNDLAHVLLPAMGWGEKDGTVTNSVRCISRQRRLPAAGLSATHLLTTGEARQDWRILRDVAHAMGFARHFDYAKSADVFREHAALSAFENEGSHKRLFNLSGLQTLSDEDYDQLSPLQWPVTEEITSTIRDPENSLRLFGDGVFCTEDGKARFVAVQWQPPANATDTTWPLVLNTGRIRDQWHTMTRTGLSASLNQHKPEPFVELHSDTALRYHIQSGHLVRISTRWGNMLARATTDAGIRRGDVFVPIHWNDQFARNARVGALVNPATDRHSGQPEGKHTPCQIEHWTPDWTGFVFSRQELSLPTSQWASKIRGEHFFRYEIAGEGPLPDLDTLSLITGVTSTHEPALLFEDQSAGRFRWAHLVDGELESCVFVEKGDSDRIRNADRRWLASLFSKATLDPLDRKALLSGKSPAGVEDAGRTVCACYGVGEKTICNAIARHQLKTAAEVGQHLKAGTNCGSCVAEIKALIEKQSEPQPTTLTLP
ncbi:Assimilatory nitrate reductase [gamma proteobacterium HdN1]|nr:Assimilatory nitrate reductase [gamma proteobacterium HdN1]